MQVRIREKRGLEVRELVARYLPKAQESEIDEFREFAGWTLKRRLRTMLFNGFREDARQTIRQFKDLFAWWLRCSVYILTIFPGITSAGMQWISWLKHAAGLNRQVTRRYKKSETKKHTKDND